ncbi:hypothetical protein [Telmatospirillum siberiense]|uniref:Uncharacterized protein n=1 Tax=Telmatospirillum siberiense TaxID=382514 RepID=A0A2N3PUX1_9PROT|nr:hypothetical protein [Telmatospirillum siberiense]PKU24209.1 hypothetical protein CWS72_12840 [Telmatospirillum siberiense]
MKEEISKMEFLIDKKAAEALFENNVPDIFGLENRKIDLVISSLAYVDANDTITVRLQTETDGREPPYNFAVTPYVAAKLALALTDLVNRTGQFKIKMEVTDPERGVVATLPKKKSW